MVGILVVQPKWIVDWIKYKSLSIDAIKSNRFKEINHDVSNWIENQFPFERKWLGFLRSENSIKYAFL